MVKFSVIIPAKNEEYNISRCLHALQNQTVPSSAFEVIIVDNGSSDATVSVAGRLGAAVCYQPDLSLSALRNHGAGAAEGEILVFLDADCIPERDWLENAAATLADPEVGCTGSTPVAPPTGTWVERSWSSFRTRRTTKGPTSWINSSNLMVRRELFEQVHGFNDKVKTCEDVDICMRLGRICTILFDPAIKVVHLGEPKTVKQFFRKEVWRGKGSISGVISHGIRISELRSLLLPLYYLLVTAALLLSLASLSLNASLFLLLMYLLPSALFSIWIISRTQQVRYLFMYCFLFLVYANARAVALFAR